MRRPPFLSIALFAVAALAGTPVAALDDDRVESMLFRTGVPGTEEIKGRIASLQESNASDAAGSIRELQQAIALLEQAQAQAKRIASIEAEIASIPGQVQQLEQELDRISEGATDLEAEIAAAKDSPIEAIQLKFDELRGQLASARSLLAQTRIGQLRRIEESSRLAESIDAARVEYITAVERARVALENDASIENASTVLAVAGEARAAAKRAYFRLLPRHFIASAEVQELRLRLAEERNRAAEDALRAWAALLEQREAGGSDEAIARVDAELAGLGAAIPIIDKAAAQSRALLEQAQALRRGETGRSQRTADLFRRADTLDRLLAVEMQQLMLGGSQAIGEGLRQQLAGIGQIEALERELDALRREALRFYLLELELGQQLARLQSPQREARRLIAESGAGVGDPKAVEASLTNLLESRRTLLLRPLLDEVRQQLGLIDEQAQSINGLLDSLARLRGFLLENLFTLRTGSPIGPTAVLSLASVGEAIPDRVAHALTQAVQRSIDARPAAWLFSLLGLAAMLALRGRIVRRLVETGERIRRIATDSFWRSIEAFVLSALLAAPIPLGLLLLGRAIEAGGGTDAFLLILGDTLASLASPAGILCLTREVARAGGLGEAHFRWPVWITARLRRGSFILLVAALPMNAIAKLMLVGIGLRTSEGSEGVSRLTLVACGLLVSAILAWIFSKRPGASGGGDRRTLPARAAILLAIAIPLAAVVLAWLGYALASHQVMHLAFQSAWIVVGGVLVRDLLLRWLSAASRKIAREQLERKRHEAMAESVPMSGGSDLTEATEDPEVDLAKVNAQSLRVIQSVFVTGILLGLAVVWSGILPALSGLNQIVLWETMTAVSSTVDEGTVNVLKPISIVDLLGALLVVLLTVVLTRDIPGLLQLLVLPRLPVSAGVGYAITSFTRYALGVIGILIAFGMIGLRWNQVQWLASAAVLGLSFGLQEIFSNFVSGVLMLVEQPVRVGDVVTVNGVTGRVTRIQIRATTITDWDRRDLVIPNKAFITGQFSNWTLSDNRTRQVVEIGVAYGSDYRLVERLLLAAASGDPDIATDPMPSVVLKAFADSSVVFDLRFVIEDVAKISSTTHHVKLRLAELFSENGVEIPFPQRDLHLRSVDPEAMKAIKPA